MAGPSPSPDAEVEYDVFVSYAHADDWALQEDKPGWVHHLVKVLRRHLQLHLGRPPSCYLDDQLALGGDIPGKLLRAIERSRILLLVLTPSYLNSKWCQSELAVFVERTGRRPESVFIAEAIPIEPTKWPESLRALEIKRAQFWQKDPTDLPERLDFLLEEHQTAYARCVNRLASFIKDRILEPEPRPSKGDVWIAEPTDDVRKEWNELAAALDQAGWRVLPQSDYPIHEHGPFTMRLRGHLQSAALFVQLIGAYEGRRVEGDSSPLPLVQAVEAHAVSKQRQVPWLRWRSKGLAAAAAEAGAANDPLLHEGEVQEGQFAEFKRRVLETVNALGQPVPRQKQQPAAGSGDLLIDVRCDAGDQALAEKVQHSLKEFDVDSIILPGVNRMEELNSLEGCDAVIVVYGTTPVPWVQAQFSLLRRAFGKVRPKGPIGILKAPPPPKPASLGISSSVLQTLDGTAGIEPAILKDFVDRVRAESAQGRGHA